MSGNGNGEVGSDGLPFYIDVFEDAAEFSLRGEDAGNSVKHTEVGILEGVVGSERGLARVFYFPRTEVALRNDLSGGRGVGEIRGEGCRLAEPDAMHREPMDYEFMARLLWVAGNELEPGILRDQFVHEHGNVPRFEMPVQWRSFGTLLFRRDVDGHRRELDASNVPRLVNQAGP